MRTIPVVQLGDHVEIGSVVEVDGCAFKVVDIAEGETVIVQIQGQKEWEHVVGRETFGQGWEQLVVRTPLAYLSLAQAEGASH